MSKIVVILLYILIQGCTTDKIEGYLYSYIEQNYKETEPILDMQDVTDFEWDYMYVFGGYDPYSQIEEDIGLNYKPFSKHNPFASRLIPEYYKRFIFIRNNKIIYEEDYKESEGRVDICIKRFSKTNSKFHVKRFDSGRFEACAINNPPILWNGCSCED